MLVLGWARANVCACVPVIVGIPFAIHVTHKRAWERIIKFMWVI